MKRNPAGKLRELNHDAVLAALRRTGTANVAELAAATGLSIATCAGIAAELAGENLARELPDRESTGGRPGRRYAYNPDHFRAAVIAVESNKAVSRIACTVVNALGNPVEGGEEKVARAAPEALGALLKSLRARHSALRAVAVSLPGVVRDGVVGLCDAPEFSGIDLKRRIESAHGLTASVDNDVNYAALGTWRSYGAGEAPFAFLYFSEDSPPGGGLVVNGGLVRGKSNFAGEISFLPVWGRKSGGRPPEIARMICSVAAIVNPEVVVLSGSAVRAGMLSDIRKRCLAMLPPEHLPELALRTDFEACRSAGMTAAALGGLQ